MLQVRGLEVRREEANKLHRESPQVGAAFVGEARGLQREEMLKDRLNPLIEKQVISGYQALSNWVPSSRIQAARRALIDQKLLNEEGPLATLAAILFIAHLIDSYWLVMPALHPTGLAVSWLDFVTPIGLGGLWLSFFLSQLKTAPLLPVNDPGMQFAFVYGH